jgi:hypothetical protein
MVLANIPVRAMSREREPQLSIPIPEQLRAVVAREAAKADRSMAAQVRVIISDWAARREQHVDTPGAISATGLVG